MALDDNSKYDVEVIQMGENVFCTVWCYTFQKPYQFEISIYGSGNMYGDIAGFKVIQRPPSSYNTPYSWQTVWNSCSGECGAHGSSPRPDGIIYVPSGITSIATRCFCTDLNRPTTGLKYYNSVYKIVIEGQVTRIGDRAFSVDRPNSYLLNSDNGTETIVNDENDKLKEIDFMVPNYIEYVGDYAFEARTQLQVIDFGGHTPYDLGGAIFKNCYNLRSVNIGHGREIRPLEFEDGINFGSSTFENCFSLIDTISILTLDNIHSSHDFSGPAVNAFKNCYALRMINMPHGSDKLYPYRSNFRCDKVLYNSLLSSYRIRGDNDFELEHVLRNVNFDGDYFLLFLNEMASDVTWPYCHDWHGLENRRLIEVGDGKEHHRPYIAINSYVKDNDNVPVLLTIPLYPTPQYNSNKYLPINFDGRIWWLETSWDNYGGDNIADICWNNYTDYDYRSTRRIRYGRLLSAGVN
jgi:hypothetical protein